MANHKTTMSEESKNDLVKEAREILETHSIVAMRVDKPYKEIRPLISALCNELEELRRLNGTQADSIMEFQEEQRAFRQALVEVAIPYEALLADKQSRTWLAPEVWATIEQAVKAARSVITPKGSEQ